MMRHPIKRLTRAQLIEYFNVYRDAFPDWDVEHRVVLTRSLGPVKQFIALESLRSGAYRPSNSIDIVGPADGSQILFMYLDVKHREVFPREHETKAPLVIKAMEEQFVPRVREPLDLRCVLQFAEEWHAGGEVGNANGFSGLATLNAYIGNRDRALWWCDRFDVLLASIGREPADWEERKAAYVERLREAIEVGHEQVFLQEAFGLR